MPQTVEYLRPEDRATALEILRRPGLKAVPVLVRPKPISWRVFDGDALLDLSRLGLDAIERSPDGCVSIGALATLEALVGSPLLDGPARGLLTAAVRHGTTPAIRNVASLGGALQDPGGAPEFTLALLALGAEVLVWETETAQRALPLEDFIARGSAALEPGELVAGLRLQLPAGKPAVWALERVARTPRDAAIVCTVVWVAPTGDGGLRIAVTIAGADPLSRRVVAAEAALGRGPLTAETIEQAAQATVRDCQPVGDFRGSQEYRRAMAGVVVRRALQSAAAQLNR